MPRRLCVVRLAKCIERENFESDRLLRIGTEDAIDQRTIRVGNGAPIGDEACLCKRHLHGRIIRLDGIHVFERAYRTRCVVEPHQRVAQQVPALEVARRRRNPRAQPHYQIAERRLIGVAFAQNLG